MDADNEKVADLRGKIKSLCGFIGDMRLTTVYLRFDVEATRRERDFWRKKAEGKNGKGKA
jgi:hypothetical protein